MCCGNSLSDGWCSHVYHTAALYAIQWERPGGGRWPREYTMSKTIVFIHGAWMTPLCWEDFSGFFMSRGYTCLAPAWPYRDRPIAELRANPPAKLAGLGLASIVEHYVRIVAEFPEPPVLIGHSFGGLLVQLLLDRGLGRAGVAIDSAPPRGILITQPSAIKANAGVLFKRGAHRAIVHLTFEQFRYGFMHSSTEADARAAYERHVVPETGRIFFQEALAALDRRSPTRVNFGNDNRPPLLLIAGQKDHLVPAAITRANYHKYMSKSVTDFEEFVGRTHWIIAQPGWEQIASYISQWIDQL